MGAAQGFRGYSRFSVLLCTSYTISLKEKIPLEMHPYQIRVFRPFRVLPGLNLSADNFSQRLNGECVFELKLPDARSR